MVAIDIMMRQEGGKNEKYTRFLDIAND